MIFFDKAKQVAFYERKTKERAEIIAAYARQAKEDAKSASETEALEQEVAELLYATRDRTWQIQARKVIALLKGRA